MNVTYENSMAGKDYEGNMGRAVERALTAAAMGVEGQAVLNANFAKGYQTGRTKGSITWATSKKRSYPSGEAGPNDGVSAPSDERTAHVGTNVEYAQHLEYGTRHMQAQPFLRKALDNNRSKIRNAFQIELRKALRGNN